MEKRTVFKNYPINLNISAFASWLFILWYFKSPDFIFMIWLIILVYRIITFFRHGICSDYIDLDDPDDVPKIKAFVQRADLMIKKFEAREKAIKDAESKS